MKIASIILRGIKRAFTASGGGYLTVTAPVTNKLDIEAYIALFLRGIVAIGLAWVAMKVGVPVPNINAL